MQVQEKIVTIAEKDKVITKHTYRPALKLSWNKNTKEDEVLAVEQLRTPDEQAICCMATD